MSRLGFDTFSGSSWKRSPWWGDLPTPPHFQAWTVTREASRTKNRYEGASWTRSTENLRPGLVGLRSQVEAGSARVIGVQKFSSFLKGGV